MYYTLEIQKLLNRADVLDDKEKDKVKYYVEAIHIADVHDDVDYAYELRHRLLDIEWNQSHRPNFISTFSWILDAYDAKPDAYEADELLWKYKWVISELNANPNVSRQQIDKVMSDFKRRSEVEGFNHRAYYSKLLHEATDQQDVARSREYQNMIDTFERDYISDCEACEMDSDVMVSLLEGKFDEAYSKSTPLLDGIHSCAKVPFITRINLAYYAFKNGDIELAEKMIQGVEDELVDREDDAYLVHSIGYFFAVLFQLDESKGWHYFEKFASHTVGTDASTLFFFSTGIVEGLKNSDGDREISLDIPEEHVLYRTDGLYRVGAVRDYYLQQAHELGEQFDERNGNDSFRKQIIEA